MKTITQTFIQDLVQKAATSPRLRSHHNFHESLSDPIHRVMIALAQGTYIRPHRHTEPGKFEFTVALLGQMSILLFDDQGTVTDIVSLDAQGDTRGFEIPQNVWHAWLTHTGQAAFLEVKKGPYDPKLAQEFAAWSPAEGDPAVPEFLKTLYAAKAGQRIG